MSSGKRSKIKFFLRVTAGFAVLALFLIGLGLGHQRLAASRAMKSRERIEATLSAPDSFTPPLSAPIAPDRLEVFLAVRADLASYCPAFTELTESIAAVDARGASIEGSEEMPPREELARGLGEIRSAFRSVLGATTKLNAYGIDRNEALLRHGMGLGEFTFVNIVACFSAKGLTPGGFLGPAQGARIYENRVAGQLREMIGRHAALLAGELDAALPDEQELLRRRSEAWRGEYEALAANPARVAFVDGLPAEVEQVLRPFENRLEQLCCPATSELDLARVVPSGKIWYDHR